METVQDSTTIASKTTAESLAMDYDAIYQEARAIEKELLRIWKYEWVLPRSAHLRDILTAHIYAAE